MKSQHLEAKMRRLSVVETTAAASLFSRVKHVGLVLLLILALAVHAQAASAKTISLDSVIEKTLANNFDLKIADVDTKIANADRKIARADLFPTLTGGYNTQYSRGLSGNQGLNQVAVVGNTVLPGATGFQHVYSLGANYTLFDGGAKMRTYLAAKKKMQATAAGKLVTARDLKLAVTQLYTDALMDYEGVIALRQSQKLHHQLFAIKRELEKSRTISKIELAEVALQMATVDSNLERLQENLSERLNDLSNYTQERYDINDIELEELPQATEAAPKFTADKLPDIQRFNKQIESQKEELRVIGLQRLPQVGFYTNMIFYGGDQNSWGQALMNTGARQVYGGLNISLPLFDGFKNSAMREKKKAEIRRTELERDKAISTLKFQHEKYTTAANQYSVELNITAELVNTSKNKEAMIQKLNAHQLVDLSKVVSEQINVIDQKLALQKARSLRLSSLRKAAIIAM